MPSGRQVFSDLRRKRRCFGREEQNSSKGRRSERINNMRILVADDEPISRRLVESALRKAGHEVIAVGDGEEAWHLLNEDDFDITVLDWMMPGLEGISICEKLRHAPRDYYLYIILLTSKADHKDIIRGLDAGADEFLAKPFDADELRARVRAGERIVTLERRLKNVNLQLEALAATDELTGLLNRRAIMARIGEEAKRAVRENYTTSVVMLDLDNFKQINDIHGHLIGDAMLKEMSRRLILMIRPYDSLGRLGGDEFILLLPHTSEALASKVAERLRKALCNEPFVAEDGSRFSFSASFGVAPVYDGGDEESFLAAADEALYAAKHKGGNTVCLSSEISDGFSIPGAARPFETPASESPLTTRPTESD
jgi:two-component system, cell cycle response regulator